MASTNITDPFVLSSYTSSSRGKSAQKNAPGIYATSYSKSNTSDGFVTVAAQADGLHIVDVSALHPIVSHTLGPSTSFACPPVTLPSSSTAGSSTYAVISASSQLSAPEDAGRAIWMWNDDVKDAKQFKQSKALFTKEIQGLYSCKAVSQRIAAVSSIGDVALVDAESLEVKASLTGNASSVLGAYVFSTQSATFVSGDEGAVLVLCQAGKSKATHLRILAIDEADSIFQRHEWELPVDSSKIASVSCSEAGTVSILTLDGTLSSFILSAQEPRPLSPLRLAGFSFISSSSKTPVSLLALTSSHVLLAGVVGQEIALLLWDLQFSVLLASHTLSIPSALSPSTLQVRLVSGTQATTKTQDSARGNVFLILSSDTAEGKTTSVLLAVPYAVPVLSTIAAAMGKGAAGKKWLVQQGAEAAKQKTPGGAGKAKQTPEEAARANLLSSMRSAVQGGRPQAATAAFMKWVPEEESAAKQALDYNFVKSILNVTLELPTSESAAAPTLEVTQYLLQKRIVSSAMVSTPGGLLGALRARGDWKSIEMAFETVLDLTEAEMIECLRVVVAHHQSVSGKAAPAPAALEDAMDVDEPQAQSTTSTTPAQPSSTSTSASSTSTPSLSAFLNLVAGYSTSRGPLLVALRRYLKDAAEITRILEVLSGWLKQRAQTDEHLMPTNKDLKKSEQGVWLVVGRKSAKRSQVPPLQKIVDFVQAILDASFITLLQHAPAHKVLRALNAQLTPEIAFADAAESLRGSLEPFAMAQQKAVKDSLIPPQEREREKQSVDWRQRRRGPGAAPGVHPDIGVYRLEHLWL